MVHTCTVTTTLSRWEYHTLYNALYDKNAGTPWNNSLQYRFSDHAHGINLFTVARNRKKEDDYTHYWAEAYLNLAKLAGLGSGELYTDEYRPLCDNFYAIMFSLTGYEDISVLSRFRIKRIDYAVDIRTDSVALYRQVFQRGEKPPGMTIKGDAVVQYENGIAYTYKTTDMLNSYDKEQERLNQGYTAEEAGKWRNVLRFELQSKRKSVQNIRKKTDAPDTRLTTFLLDDSISREIVRKMVKFYNTIAGRGDYYTLRAAVKKLHALRCNIDDMLDAEKLLREVDKRGSVDAVWKSQDEKQKRKTRRIIRWMSSQGINAATIPAGSGTDHLESLTAQFQHDVKASFPSLPDEYFDEQFEEPTPAAPRKRRGDMPKKRQDLKK